MEGLVVVHDDDYFYAGTKLFKNKVIADICEKYKMSTQSAHCSNYNGVEITQNEASITISQNVDNINEIPLSITRMMHKHNELNLKEKKQLRASTDLGCHDDNLLRCAVPLLHTYLARRKKL